MAPTAHGVNGLHVRRIVQFTDLNLMELENVTALAVVQLLNMEVSSVMDQRKKTAYVAMMSTVQVCPLQYQRWVYLVCLTMTCLVVFTEDGVWSEWDEWSDCDKKCGIGEKFRTRSCSPPQFGGALCPGYSREYVLCQEKECRKPNVKKCTVL